MAAPQYNSKCAGVKRLMREASELAEPTEMFFAQPLEDNLFEWHFTVRGPLETKFDGGIYHGKIIFPSEYPMKPPNLIILTPNGRFELNRKICLSISGYHPETWLPSWSVRTAILALIGFMPTDPRGAIGGLDYPEAEVKRLAKKSLEWTCKECGICMKTALKPLVDGSAMEEAKKLATQLVFKNENDNSRTSSVSETEKPSSNNPEEGAESATSTVSPESNTQVNSTIPRNVNPSPRNEIRESSSCDMQLFIFIPLCVLSFAVFGVLLARRAYM